MLGRGVSIDKYTTEITIGTGRDVYTNISIYVPSTWLCELIVFIPIYTQ